MRDKLTRIQDERKHVAGGVKQTEDFINNNENSAEKRKELEDRVRQLKTRLELLESEEQQRQTREIEAEQQLRAEEVRLERPARPVGAP